MCKEIVALAVCAAKIFFKKTKKVLDKAFGMCYNNVRRKRDAEMLV